MNKNALIEKAFKIIAPEAFRKIPWKNGLGVTTELAINEGGSLANFDWRLSIASVTQDGLFSNFAGYTRNLVLLSGNGIELQHSEQENDQVVTSQKLDNILQFVTFDGGYKTLGKLNSGSITDFIVMTKTHKVKANIATYRAKQVIALHARKQYFIYSLASESTLYFTKASHSKSVGQTLTTQESAQQVIPKQHLLQISAENHQSLLLDVEQAIVIELSYV